MRIVLSWMREYCPTDLPAEQLAERLTANGVKVEGILWPWAGLEGVVVARVIEVEDHPGSDRLSLARLDAGGSERRVVVGVRNMKPGDLVPLAAPGSRVPALDEPLTAREIRGVVSDGMLCSARELAVSTSHEGILILPPSLTPGADVKTVLGLDDAVFDVEIEPNRPDLTSVFGVAREAAIATGAPLIDPPTDLEEAEEKAENEASVEIRDLERCPRYVARVLKDVKSRPSPIVAQARLTTSGMRPLSSVVDATNYAMLELGHPMHPFDLHLLEGRRIVVRRAAVGESVTTLDGVERSLTPEDLVIADEKRAVALAGVMGSDAAEVSDETTDLLLESAYFDPRGIMRTRRRIGLSTEASQRFERGADPEAPPRAADRAARLIVEWSGGRVLSGAIDVGSAPPRRRVGIRPARASLVLGHDVPEGDVRSALEQAGMEVTGGDAELEAEVPGYRVDVVREEDLIEEVARITGYDRIGSALPPVRQAGSLGVAQELRRRMRGAAVSTGLREIRSLSFASKEDLDTFGGDAIRVRNPLAAEEGFLRTSLLPGMLHALSRNRSRQIPGAALFEIGIVFGPADPKTAEPAMEPAMEPVMEPVSERERFGVVMGGSASDAWPDGPRNFDFFDVKGTLEAFLSRLGVRDWWLRTDLEKPFHPGRSASVHVAAGPLGVMGELHPAAAAGSDLSGRVGVLELDVQTLREAAGERLALRDVPRFPPARRDLAFIVDAAVAAADVERALRERGGELVRDVRLFDVFTGTPVPEGKRSLAFAIDFRAPERTLTDEEVDAAVAGMVQALERELGAELRSG